MPSVASSSVTPIRSHAGAGSVEELDALVIDPATDPETFDAVADAHPEAWAVATILAALARIAGDDRDHTVADQLQAVADGAVADATVVLANRLRPTVSVRAVQVALASATERDSVVLVATHGVEAVDDVTALLLTYRATALARVGMVVSAHETVARVLRSRQRHPAVRDFARHQRDTVWRRERMA